MSLPAPHSTPPSLNHQSSSMHTPTSHKSSSHTTVSDTNIVFLIKHGFHDILKREIGDSIYSVPDLHSRIFSDEVIQAGILNESFRSLVNAVHFDQLPPVNGSDSREAQWASRLKMI
ncbi:hypothetical protein DXG03_009289 [Asterophora parasitica]|uniref:Uncharacterized protein n=1 Tax=Asterophora parasitica TaxID=117018 RepID=A0A9P7G044_9AGAR|nr:hypothetical protein DXG03_009289 [Asterophora parasitica]